MRFCTVVNCMDGRTQLPVIEYLQARFGAAYVDTITEPGPDLILAAAPDSPAAMSICHRIEISLNGHGSGVIAVVGHHDCAGNPVGRDEHFEHVRSAVTLLAGKYPRAEVIGLWVDETWAVSEVDPASRPPHAALRSWPGVGLAQPGQLRDERQAGDPSASAVWNAQAHFTVHVREVSFDVGHRDPRLAAGECVPLVTAPTSLPTGR